MEFAVAYEWGAFWKLIILKKVKYLNNQCVK